MRRVRRRSEVASFCELWLGDGGGGAEGRVLFFKSLSSSSAGVFLSLFYF